MGVCSLRSSVSPRARLQASIWLNANGRFARQGETIDVEQRDVVMATTELTVVALR